MTMQTAASAVASAALLILSANAPAYAIQTTISDVRWLEGSGNTTVEKTIDAASDAGDVGVFTSRQPLDNPGAPRQTTWFPAGPKSSVASNDSIRVSIAYRVALSVPAGNRFPGTVVLAPQVLTKDRLKTVLGDIVETGTAKYQLVDKASGTREDVELHVFRGALVVTSCPGKRFTMHVHTPNAPTEVARCQGTSWLLAVDEVGKASLIVTSGIVTFDNRSEIKAEADSTMWEWGTGVAGDGPQPRKLTAAQLAIISDAIAYNGGKIWKKGFSPLVLIPIAIPPLVCAIACESGGLAGTVRIPVP